MISNCPEAFDQWLATNLICPVDHLSLSFDGKHLFCEMNHKYRVLQGIPIMLVDGLDATHHVFTESIALSRATDEELEQLLPALPAVNGIDEYVQGMIGATNGTLYKHLRYKLKRYPIPELRLPEGRGKVFLELGCNWGRWCLSASRKGYFAVGIDPSFKGLLAAKRVAKELSMPSLYVVADARHLPFSDDSIDIVFSYSVLQHFGKKEVFKSLTEISRVLKGQGQCLIQLPNKYGLVNFIRQMQKGYRKVKEFDVRYWSPKEMLEAFSEYVGSAELSVDGFFSLNAQTSDRDLLKPCGRMVVSVSEALRKLGSHLPPLIYLADSLYVRAIK